MKFRDDFVWGAATSSYQIEGGQYEGGKGIHLWDEYVKQKGKVFENQRGDVSCDHYHRYKEDVKLMKELGIKAYRFSVDWTRIMPNGKGKINEEGIAFYNSLIDELVANDIEPYLTLFHWELPMELYKRGGWMNPKMPEWFGAYAAVIADRFSDRVKNFIIFHGIGLVHDGVAGIIHHCVCIVGATTADQKRIDSISLRTCQ